VEKAAKAWSGLHLLDVHEGSASPS
jgi:hypothetical protein